MTSPVEVGPWATLGADALALRIAVFVHEQGVPMAMEQDDDDPHALHALLRDAAGTPVATGRLLEATPAHPGVMRIGRMAVAHGARGQGAGTQVLRALVAAAQARGATAVTLHAQCHAQAFYARHGFAPRGDVFDEAGIAHVEMVLRLTREECDGWLE